MTSISTTQPAGLHGASTPLRAPSRAIAENYSSSPRPSTPNRPPVTSRRPHLTNEGNGMRRKGCLFGSGKGSSQPPPNVGVSTKQHLSLSPPEGDKRDKIDQTTYLPMSGPNQDDESRRFKYSESPPPIPPFFNVTLTCFPSLLLITTKTLNIW
jgi:hypothetical protein